MELDPHQLIEGILIACYAVDAAQAFLYVRGEMALAQERIAQALNDAYANNLIGRNILGTDFSRRHRRSRGAPAPTSSARRRRSSRASRASAACRGSSRRTSRRPRACTCSRRSSTTSRRCANLPWIINESGQAFHDIGAADVAPACACSPCPVTSSAPACSRSRTVSPRSAMLFEAPEYCGGVREGRNVKAFIPGGAGAMWFFEEHLDLPLDKPTVDKAGSMLGSGAIVVMDDTTDIVAACWHVVRFFARESCGKCTPCREGTHLAGADPQADPRRARPRPRTSISLIEVSESISPGIAWPPRQTTICPLGPSAVSPIASAIKRFRARVRALHRARTPDRRRRPSRHPRRPPWSQDHV